MKENKSQLRKGLGVSIGENCIFEGLKNNKGSVTFGDYCQIHEKCRFYIADKFKLGDYGIIHNNTLVQGYKSCIIGHNAWIGQNSIINATDTLKIGNNLGIGTDSKIWTHAFHGELLLGCRIAVAIPDYESQSGAVTIGDDFWGVGQITISPGITIGNRVIALTNSLITKDVPDNTIVAGIPAKPFAIDGDFRGYIDLSEKERFDLMKKFSMEFSKLNQIKIEIDDKLRKIVLGKHEIVIDCGNGDYSNPETSYFDIIKRTYTKKHNVLEKKFMNFVLGYRARFTPQ